MWIIARLAIPLGLAWVLYTAAESADVNYPGASPGATVCSLEEEQMSLSNEAIRCRWTLRDGRPQSLEICDVQAAKTVRFDAGFMPRIVLADDRIIDLAEIAPAGGFRCETVEKDAKSPRGEDAFAGRLLTAEFFDDASGLTIRWSAELRDGANYVVQSICLSGKRDVNVKRIVFLAADAVGARQVGEVGGSVVVCDNLFLAAEHPLAVNTVTAQSRVECSFSVPISLAADEPARCVTAVMGVTPPGQPRRGFLYYLERRRAHPYRPFLHYNSWYHLNIGRPDCRMEEKECLDTIELIGRELVEKRGVELDAFVWDDGWDDPHTFWDFHDGFPRGFSQTLQAGKRYGAVTGVWMSPWGGYEPRKTARLANGEKLGFKIKGGDFNRFTMSDANYFAAFLGACRKMVNLYETAFFKFDGIGAANQNSGEVNEYSVDTDAVLRLAAALRREHPHIFIDTTCGTWTSPFWLLFSDCVWRQGLDVGFHGPGDNRERWITYRDMVAYERGLLRGPLFPLNSLMFHGLCIGERAEPGEMPRDEKSVADEIWMMFGCGAGIQELYISPHLLTPKMWDELAAAAKWSRANSDVLVDTHWVGGNPGKGEVYGFGSWSPRKGILILRNPAEKSQVFEFSPRRDWELPPDAANEFPLRIVHGENHDEMPKNIAEDGKIVIELAPFEVLLIEAEPAKE